MNLNDLKNALQNDALIYYYQPKVSMITGDICGAEALLRWIEPNGNIISPAEFIPLAESSGFIKEITLSMFDKLIIDFNIIKDFNDSIVMSFNVSPIDFEDDRLLEAIKQAIQNNLIPANKLEVEITESTIISNDEKLMHRILLIQEMGVGLAMDDFGTGYSSLLQLVRIPFNELKIDLSFVKNYFISPEYKAVAETAVILAHQLKMTAVAEGIEDQETYDALKMVWCDEGQGYHIAKPMLAPDFELWVQEHNTES